MAGDRPGEFELIERHFAPLARGFPGAFGLRNDIAVISPPAGYELIVKTAAIVAGVHFLPGDPAELIARKALRVNLSDIAAGGGAPLAYQMALALPADWTEDWVSRFCAGLAADQQEFHIHLCGGDTVSTPGPLTVSLTAFGLVPAGKAMGRAGARAGDDIWVSGTIGEHGMAVLSARERLDLDALRSDSASIVELVGALFDAGIDIRLMRDPTRGGLCAVLHEFAEAAGVTFRLEEASIPVSERVRGACELLGIDPVYAACEGRFVAVVPADDADRAVRVLREHPSAAAAAIVGDVLPRGITPVIVRNAFGSQRPLDEPSGVLLPRIC